MSTNAEVTLRTQELRDGTLFVDSLLNQLASIENAIVAATGANQVWNVTARTAALARCTDLRDRIEAAYLPPPSTRG